MLRKVRLQRHANALPATGGPETDIARMLSATGIAQAIERRAKLARTSWDAVCSSFAQRAKDTVAIIADISPSQVEMLEILYPPIGDNGLGDELEEQYVRLKNASYAAYLADGTALPRYGKIAAPLLKEKIFETGARDILIGGHGTFLAATGFSLCAGNSTYQEIFNTLILSEAEGVDLIFNRGVVTDVITDD